MVDSEAVHLLGPADQVLYQRYGRRWYMLFLLCGLNLSNASVWVTFATVANTTADYFAVTPTAVNWLSEVFLALSIPFGFIASWALDSKGLRFSVLTGAWLNGIGAWVRFGGTFAPTEYQFAICFVGQALCGIGQPFVLSAPTKLAATWFGESERGTANMIASISNPLGIAVAGLVVPAIVSPTPGAHGDYNMPTALWILGIPAGVFLIISQLTFQEKPPTPPTSSAEEESHGFVEGLKLLFRIPAYVKLWFVFGIGVGVFNALTTLLEQIVSPHGYSNDDAGNFQAMVIGAGLVGAGIAGPIVDKTRKYLLVLKIAFVCAVLGVGAMTYLTTLEKDSTNFALLATSCVFVGMMCFAILPVALELGVETSYPIAEGTSAGFLWIAGNIWGLVFISVMDALRSDNGDMINAQYFMCAVSCSAALLSLTLQTNYRRLEAETKPNFGNSTSVQRL